MLGLAIKFVKSLFGIFVADFSLWELCQSEIL